VETELARLENHIPSQCARHALWKPSEMLVITGASGRMLGTKDLRD